MKFILFLCSLFSISVYAFPSKAGEISFKQIAAISLEKDSLTYPKTPEFKDAEVQQYANDYAKFVKEYIEAYKAKDMAKMDELSKAAQEWAARATSVSQKLANDPEQAKIFAEYTSELGHYMANAMSVNNSSSDNNQYDEYEGEDELKYFEDIPIPYFYYYTVRDFLERYTHFAKDLTEAYENYDADKIKQLQEKAKEWAAEFKEIVTLLEDDPDDLALFNKYINRLAEEIQKAKASYSSNKED